MPRGAGVSFLAALALAASLVLAAARAWSPPHAILVACAGLGVAAGVAAVLRRRRAAWVAAACALAAARGGLDAERARPPDPGPDFAQERPLRLRARVLSTPLATRRGARALVRVTASDPRLPDGLVVSLWCDSAAGAPRLGAEIVAQTLARRPRPLTTPGGFDEPAWLAARGASLLARVPGAAWEEVRPPRPSPGRFLEAARRRWSDRLGARVPGEGGEFLRGLLLGERSRVSPETVDELRRAGALHLLALSGQHVLLVAAHLHGLARLCGARARGASAAALLGVWIYALLTGSSPSVVRAGASVTWSAWGRGLGRRVSGADGLAWGTAIPVFVAPSLAVDAGFQLSCLASAGLWAAARVRRAYARWREERGDASRPGLEAAVFAVLATGLAQAAVLPLLAARFGAVSAVGLASNLVLVPACDVLLSLGLPLLVADGLAPTPVPLWRVLAAVAAFLLRAGEGFASWPGAWMACSLSAAAALAMAIAGALPFGLFATGRHGLAWAALGLWLGLAVSAFAPLAPQRRAAVAYWLLDVGQGDAQVLELGDGATWLVDVGDAREGFDAGRSVVAPFLRARGVRTIERAILTHEDRDHVGGLAAVARDFRLASAASGAEAESVLRARLPRLRWTAPLAAGDTLLARDGVTVRVLWPPRGTTGLASNERSVVIEIEAGADRLVLTGDADSTSEAGWLPAAAVPLTALKLGHHGSRRSTAGATLDALHPAVALVSCGAGNRFGHPHEETLARLRARGTTWRRTDLEGTIRLELGARRSPRPRSRALAPTPRL